MRYVSHSPEELTIEDDHIGNIVIVEHTEDGFFYHVTTPRGSQGTVPMQCIELIKASRTLLEVEKESEEAKYERNEMAKMKCQWEESEKSLRDETCRLQQELEDAQEWIRGAKARDELREIAAERGDTVCEEVQKGLCPIRDGRLRHHCCERLKDIETLHLEEISALRCTMSASIKVSCKC